MNDTPRPPRDGDDDEPKAGDQSGHQSGQPQDPFAELFAQLGLGNSEQVDLNQVMAQVQRMFAGFGQSPDAGATSVDWAQARQATRQLSASKGPDPSPSSQQQRALADAARLGELWLDEVCEFPAVPATPVVWSRAEWIENTLDSWKPIVEPIVTSLGEAMGTVLAPLPEDAADPVAGLAGMFAPMLRQMAAGMYTLQFSQALAELSTQVVSGAESGLQLLPTPRVALLESNINTLFADLGLPADDVRLYLTLREAARQRLFNAVGWLAPQLLALVEHYARETSIDRDAIEQSIEVDDLQSVTPESLQNMAQNLQGKLFKPTTTEEQKGVLQRLETLLALTEGWVDHVVGTAAAKWMPTHEQLAETVRRRRGAGGPVEKVFHSLVGLELRPRRVRDAQNLWAAVEASRGAVQRDQLWSHPDLLPTSADLDDPLGFAEGESGETESAKASDDLDLDDIDLDAELAKLLEQEGRDQD